MLEIDIVRNDSWPQGAVFAHRPSREYEADKLSGVRSVNLQLCEGGIPSAQCELHPMLLDIEQVDAEFYTLYAGVHFRLVDESKYRVVGIHSGRDDTTLIPDTVPVNRDLPQDWVDRVESQSIHSIEAELGFYVTPPHHAGEWINLMNQDFPQGLRSVLSEFSTQRKKYGRQHDLEHTRVGWLDMIRTNSNDIRQHGDLRIKENLIKMRKHMVHLANLALLLLDTEFDRNGNFKDLQPE